MDPYLRWYAVYTKSRQEKALTLRLLGKGIEAWIPLRTTLKQWSDRKKRVEEPLIRSYAFVRIAPSRYDDVLFTPGAVRYVWFNGKPAAIPDAQIDTLKLITGADTEAMAVPCTFAPGTPVRVKAGPLEGLTGELVSFGGNKKVVVRLDHLEKAVSLTIAPALLERVTEK